MLFEAIYLKARDVSENFCVIFTNFIAIYENFYCKRAFIRWIKKLLLISLSLVQYKAYKIHI